MRTSRKLVYVAIALFIIAIIGITVHYLNLDPTIHWMPKVEILSGKEPVGSASTYLLKFHVVDATSVTISTNKDFAPFSIRKELTARDAIIEQEVPLPDVNTVISVYANTLYNMRSDFVSITRDKTQADVDREVAAAKVKAEEQVQFQQMLKEWASRPSEPTSGLSNNGSIGSGGGDTVSAYSCAQSAVRKHLKSPSSASFPSVFSANPGDISIQRSGSSWIVNSFVDSQNSFGVNLRTPFRCTVNDYGDSCSASCDLSN